MINTIKQKLEKEYNSFDSAHNMEHINEVVENAIKINNLLGSPYEEEIVIITALYHDIGLKYGRKDHEKNSAKIIKEDLKNIFDNDTLEIMSKACEEHRSSYTGEFTSLLSKIINDADSMYTKESLIIRSYNYAKSIKKSNEVYEEVYNHLKEKFGRNGYQKFKLDICKELPIIKEVHTMLENEIIFKKEYMRITLKECL